MEKRILGITGGVGSGKSTVLACLREEYGACVIQADELAKEVMADPDMLSLLARNFGEEILAADGRPDRCRMAQLLFSDGEKTAEELWKIRQVIGMIHGRTRNLAEERIRNAEAPLVAYEAALPKEAFLKELCREIWVVHVPAEERIRRLIRDRGYSREKALSIINAQLSDQEFLAFADRVIENGGTPEETRRQVREALAD